MSDLFNDKKKSAPSQEAVNKILAKLAEENVVKHHSLFDKAFGDFSSLTYDEIQLLITELQSVLITLDRYNQVLEHKLHLLASELGQTNLALTKKVNELNCSQQQLLEREAKLNSIFNAAIEGIITIDQSGAVISVNKAVNTIFGFSEEEIVGHNIKKIMPAAHAEKHDDFIRNYLKTGKAKVIGSIREVEGIRKDGSVVPLDLSLAEFSIDKEHYFTAIVRDVRARKLREQQDKIHLEELAHVSRLGLMGEMASGIAHEVNQPLTAISAYTQVCLDLIRSGKADFQKLEDILNKANNQALRAGQIIHRMRNFARSKTTHRSSVDINDLIQDCIGLCASDIKQYGITIKFKPEKNLHTLYIDEIQIEQVLLNLIRNSIDTLKELPEGLSRLLIISAKASNILKNIEISVKDNGFGIAESEKEKILMPFYTTKNNGSGMGLSISRYIVEAHDGTLRFNSKLGKGSTFYFTLPGGRQSDEL